MATHELPSQHGMVEKPPFPHGRRLEQRKLFVKQWLDLHPGERPNLTSMSEQLGLKPQSFRKILQRIRKEDPTFLAKEAKIADRIRLFVEEWSKSQPGKSLSITKTAKALHMGHATVVAILKEIEANEPEFPGPKKAQGLRVEDSTIENVTINIAKRHPELYPSLSSIILDADTYLSLRQAADLIQKMGFKVRVIPEGSTARFFISIQDKAKIIALLQSQSIPSLDIISIAMVRTHPELYRSLRSVINESGIRTTSPKVAELIEVLDIQVGVFPDGSSNRYFVYTQDKTRIIAFLQGLGKELLS